MILLKRREDGAIMNDRQSSDWGGVRKLENMKKLLASIPNDPVTQGHVQDAIKELERQREAWYARRKQAIIKQYGGVPSDYAIIQVPEEDTQKAMKALYIEDIDGVLIYMTGPRYTIKGAKITTSAGWVKGNAMLLEDDETDFSILTLDEPLFFRLVFAQETASLAISVQLLVRDEDEDFSDLSENLNQLDTVCEGRVDVDGTITEGVF